MIIIHQDIKNNILHKLHFKFRNVILLYYIRIVFNKIKQIKKYVHILLIT